MIDLKQEIRHAVGDALAEEDLNRLCSIAVQVLETNVGTILGQSLSTAQLDEFEAICSSDDVAEAAAWLARECPNSDEVVLSEIRSLLAQIEQHFA